MNNTAYFICQYWQAYDVLDKKNYLKETISFLKELKLSSYPHCLPFSMLLKFHITY